MICKFKKNPTQFIAAQCFGEYGTDYDSSKRRKEVTNRCWNKICHVQYGKVYTTFKFSYTNTSLTETRQMRQSDLSLC